MDQAQQIVEVVRDAHGVNDLEIHLALKFGALVVGNVLDRAVVGDDLAVRVSHHARIFRNPNLRAIRSPQLVFEVLHAAALLNQALEFTAHLGIRVNIRAQVLDTMGHLGGRRETAHARERRIRAQDAACRGGLENSFHRVFKEHGMPLFRFFLRFAGAALLGDVFVHSESADPFAVRHQRHTHDFYFHERAVAAAPPRFRAHHFPSGHAIAQREGFARLPFRGHH